MYLDEYENRGYPIKGIIMKIIIIILFFMIISALLSKINLNNKANNKNKEIISFKEDFTIIKNKALEYYNINNLPSAVDEKDLITLNELSNNNQIDGLDKEIDYDKSYVSMTKLPDEYLLKVSLTKGNNNDYILSHINSYPNCKTYLCEKKVINQSNYNGVKPVVPFSLEEINKPEEPIPEAVINPLCKVIDNKYYNQNGKRVSEVDYIIDCQKPKCNIIEGYYFNAKGKSVSKSDYIKSCKKTFKCIEIDNKYYDKNGKEVKKSVFKKECSEKTNYSYEYIKKTSVSFSNWSEWSSWVKTDCSTKEINCKNDDINCLYKQQILVKKEKNGVYQNTYETKRNILVKTGSFKKKACSNYNYIKIDGLIYATPKKSKYEDRDGKDWIKDKDLIQKDALNSDVLLDFRFKDADFSNCGDRCTTKPNFIYETYKYIGGIAKVDSLTVSSNSDGILLSEIYEEGQTNKFANSCGSFKEKEINIYKTIEVIDSKERTEPLYGDVCYKSTKERKIIGAGSTKTIWGKMNDEDLLKDGWVMTGKVKKA